MQRRSRYAESRRGGANEDVVLVQLAAPARVVGRVTKQTNYDIAVELETSRNRFKCKE